MWIVCCVAIIACVCLECVGLLCPHCDGSCVSLWCFRCCLDFMSLSICLYYVCGVDVIDGCDVSSLLLLIAMCSR